MGKVVENRKRELFYFNRPVETETKYSKAGDIDADINFTHWWSSHFKYVVDWQLEYDYKTLSK